MCIMMNEPTSENLVLRIDPHLKATLRQMAEADHRTLSDFVRLHLQALAATAVAS